MKGGKELQRAGRDGRSAEKVGPQRNSLRFWGREGIRKGEPVSKKTKNRSEPFGAETLPGSDGSVAALQISGSSQDEAPSAWLENAFQAGSAGPVFSQPHLAVQSVAWLASAGAHADLLLFPVP